jgi:hypothetical protein
MKQIKNINANLTGKEYIEMYKLDQKNRELNKKNYNLFWKNNWDKVLYSTIVIVALVLIIALSMQIVESKFPTQQITHNDLIMGPVTIPWDLAFTGILLFGLALVVNGFVLVKVQR